jgi:hypothetical protein
LVGRYLSDAYWVIPVWRVRNAANFSDCSGVKSGASVLILVVSLTGDAGTVAAPPSSPGLVDRSEGTGTRLLSGDGLALAHDLGDLAVRVGGVGQRVPRALAGRAVVHEAVAVAVDRARTGDDRLVLVVPRVGLGPVGQLAVVVHGVEPVGQQRLLTFPARPHGSAPSHAANTVGSM